MIGPVSGDDAPGAPRPFVPEEFVPPSGLQHPDFGLEPLGPEHNASDYAAWTSSMEHIHATPGFEEHPWPHEMTLEENLGDLVRHADDFAARTGFTYTVLAHEGDGRTVIGCVYIYPADAPGGEPADEPADDARVRSWVRAEDAHLDVALWRTVRDWLARDWPFARVAYAARRDRARLASLGRWADELARPGFSMGEWVEPREIEPGVFHVGWFELGEEGTRFLDEVRRGGWVQPFDWMDWLGTPEARVLSQSPELVARASEEDLQHLLTAIVRGERFSDGTIEGAFASGMLLAIARRAQVLADDAEA